MGESQPTQALDWPFGIGNYLEDTLETRYSASAISDGAGTADASHRRLDTKAYVAATQAESL